MKRTLALLCLSLLMAATARAEMPESRITYLYVTACQSCARVKALLGELPEEIEVQTAQGSVRSRLTVEEVNIAADLTAAQALFARYGVPEADQMAPAVFLRDTYYAGAEAILASLESALCAGEALSAEEALTQREGEAAGGARILGVSACVTAGLIAGLNPCALSMLLVLLSALLSAGRNAGRYAALYLAVKGACYFLIGTALYALLGRWQAAWLPAAVRFLATALSGVLIALNLMDAMNALRERYGKVRNQLPAGLRGRLNRALRKAVADHPIHLGAAVAVAGAGVAASEFLCAGQVYLATLLAGVQSGVERGRMLLLLSTYCAAFLAPSALLAGIVTRTRALFEASDVLRRAMPLIKLLTALVLAATVCFMWTH